MSRGERVYELVERGQETCRYNLTDILIMRFNGGTTSESRLPNPASPQSTIAENELQSKASKSSLTRCSVVVDFAHQRARGHNLNRTLGL
jgi:hypothetical protein